jgi:hypothetical protein
MEGGISTLSIYKREPQSTNVDGGWEAATLCWTGGIGCKDTDRKLVTDLVSTRRHRHNTGQ